MLLALLRFSIIVTAEQQANDDYNNYNDDAAAADDDGDDDAEQAYYYDNIYSNADYSAGDDSITYWTNYAILPKRCIV